MSPCPSGGGGATGPHRHRLRSKRRSGGSSEQQQQQQQDQTTQEATNLTTTITMNVVDNDPQLASRLGYNDWQAAGQEEAEETTTKTTNDMKQPTSCNGGGHSRRQLPSSRFLLCNQNERIAATRCRHMYSCTSRHRRPSSRFLRALSQATWGWTTSGSSSMLRLVTTIVLYLVLVLAATVTSSHQQQQQQQLAPTSISDQSPSSIHLPGPSLWFQQQQQQFAQQANQQQPQQRPPKSTAQSTAPDSLSASQPDSDSFGSRLTTGGDARQGTRAATSREDGPATLLDTAATDDGERVFMNRQGQLAGGNEPPTVGGEPNRLRQARQPAPSPAQQQQRPNPGLLMQQQQQQQQRARQQLAGGAPPSGFSNFPQQPPNNQDRGNQERFQRLRNNAASNNFEQFPRPQQGNFGQQQQPSAFAAGPQSQSLRQAQQQPQVALGLPTLSAFDLSSLANLANNQPVAGQLAQNQQLQPTFRRIPPPPATPQQQQQPQNQRANQQQQQQQPPVRPQPQQQQQQQQNPFPLSSQFFDSRTQVPNVQANGASSQSTELPFIRQVFRPAPETTSESSPNSPNLFASVPSEQLAPNSQFPPRAPAPSSGRPTPPPLFVPSRQQAGSQSGLRTRPLESGFSPIQPSRSFAESATPISGAAAGAAAFFEPSQQRGSGNQQNVRQQSQPARQQQALLPSQQGSQQAASEMQQQQRKPPPVRRPSQRPHVPAGGSTSGGQMAGRVSATNAVAAAAAAQPDVIRLAANAIQAANEGLAAVAASAAAAQSQQPPFADSQATTSTTAASTSTTAAAAASSSSELPPTTTSLAEAAAQTSRRAISLQTPRTSAAANFFQTLTSAATSAPSSFSPALPINQAIAATGGRRRIPVRNGVVAQFTASGRLPLTTTPFAPTTQPTTTTTTTSGRIPAAPVTTPATTTSTTTSTTQAAVRRPEIEEFYETIGGAGAANFLGGSTTTLIDGFGAPSRAAASLPQTTTTTSSSSSSSTTNTPLGSDQADKLLTTTTDLYGSRLSAGQQDTPSSSQPPVVDQNQQQPTSSGARLPSESIDRPRLAVRPPQQQPEVNEAPTSENNLQPQPPAAAQQPVMVPVTYMTTLTYLTTVLHGTHTLETSHETIEKSTRMATLNAQLMDQIEHRLPLIEPTATVSLSSRTKGRGTTLVNLKSAVSAYNQELVEALGAAGNGNQLIQPTQVPTQAPPVLATASPDSQQQQTTTTSSVANRQFQQLSFNRQRGGGGGKPQQQSRPSRTVDLKELAELKRQLFTEYVYSYTMRPVDQPDQVLATSVRSELVPGAGAMASADLASQLQAATGGESNLIDANGMLRLEMAGRAQGAGDPAAAQINLGSTIGRNTPQTMTEVNMNVATYLKFDGISNVLVDVRPTARLTNGELGEQAVAPSQQVVPAAPTGLSGKSQLDTSFNVHMTLGNALEQLAQQSPQQTPALEPTSVTSAAVSGGGQQANAIKISETAGGSTTSAAAAAMAMAAAAGAAVAAAGDTGGNQAAAASATSSSLARSQLRSRVASSRFRTLQPSRAAAAAVSASPVLSATASVSETAAPSISGLRQRPNKSRILRPSLLQRASSQQPASEISSSPSMADSSVSPTSVSASVATRSSKPRFVVVTRTGQFGIRASAISSLAAASSSSVAATDQQPPVDPSPTSSAATPTVRVSSRFSKPNRFRGPSQSITRLPAEQIPVSVTSIQPPVAAQPETASSVSVASQQQPVVESSKVDAANQDPAATIKLDGSDSVVVTYFTTTTHTIPFELNSETVFTTIEETNSRIATERMSDLNSRFIEPTATASLPAIEQTAAPSMQQPPVTTTSSSSSSTTTTSSPNEQTTTQQASGTTSAGGSEPSTSGATSPAASEQQQHQQQQQNKPVIDPSFVTSLNTRTYFTTFTHFTTYSAGTGSQTVESSESTTSNVVTETITETVPTAPSQSAQVPAESSSVLQEQSASDLPVTRTLLSTMTYYGTVYNGTQTSLTPILDVSTQVLTMNGGGGDASTSGLSYLNSNALSSTTGEQVAPTSQGAVPSSSSTSVLVLESSVAPTPPLDSADKITRTKSMYTTLTHFITFYSGTKTQLSTIQEISPTVVTEYIDRTLFEQQQAEASAASSSSQAVLLLVPSASVATPEPEVATATPAATTTTTTTTTTGQPETTANNGGGATSGSSESTSGDQGPQTTMTTTTSTTTTTTSQPELGSVSVSTPERPASDNQQVSGEPKVLASSGQDQSVADLSVESKQATNIIELSDLIASNSSQSSRVALAGNLGAAIKDIVQLLAGNKTATATGAAGPRPPVNFDNLPFSSSTTTTISEQTSSSSAQTEAAPPTTTTTTTTPTSTPTTSTTANPPTTHARRPNGGPPTRVFGNKQRTSAQSELHGSISSPATPTTSTSSAPLPSSISFDDATTATTSSGGNLRPTPELPQSSNAVQQRQAQPAATIFFGDDSGDERKKQIKTVWPGAQSTVFVTSVEPSTRSLTVTTTKVYYTRDAPMTVTSSYTSVIAPRTFVSTIVGTRTLVNQLGGASAQVPLAPMSASSRPPPAAAQPNGPQRPADTQNAAVATRYKQQKQQQQQVATEARKVNLELHAKQKQAEQAKVAARAKLEQQQQQANAMIAQCQPACKQSANEVCKFTPSPTDGSNGQMGSFACACRPGYYMSLNAVGQRACQEVQSYVVMLRLLQIGNEQVAYKRELQNRASPEFKQVSKIVREHVKRAYMTSDLVRDRYVGADILNFARTLSVSSGTASQSLGAQPNSGRQPLAINSSLLDPLNAGVIVNMTIHLQQQQPSDSLSQQVVDESMLKEELTKKLNMRQAAALAAAAAQAASAGETSVANATTSTTSAAANTQADQPAAPGGVGAGSGSGNQTEVEPLPNPNALFLADVEHVQDLDECANPALNDCHEGAVCVNEPGSYRCDCREYPDLNPLQPGRQCAHELKSCDFCHNRGDCLRVPSLLSSGVAANSSNVRDSSGSPQPGNGRGQSFSTVCQCHRLFMGRHCEINGLLLSTLLPIVAILLIISVSLIIFCCRRWRRRSSLSKGFRNIGSFGPNMIGSTLDRKAMLESSSESSDTHQRHAHAAAAAAAGHLHPHTSPHNVAAQLHHPPTAHLLRQGGGGGGSGGLYDASEPSSSQESSPRQMSRGQLVDAGGPSQGSSLNPYCNSIPPQIVIPRARHNQVNYAVHRGQVYMW